MTNQRLLSTLLNGIAVIFHAPFWTLTEVVTGLLSAPVLEAHSATCMCFFYQLF